MQESQQASPAGAGQQAGQHAQQAIIQPNRFDAVKALPPALNLAAPATAEDMKSLKAYVDAIEQYAGMLWIRRETLSRPCMYSRCPKQRLRPCQHMTLPGTS